MKKIILLVILCLVLMQVQAQRNENIFAVSWEVAFPSSNYLSKTSFSGGRLEYRKMINKKFSAGLGLSWNSFNEYQPTKTYTSGDGATAVTTDMIRQIYIVPITAIFHYYPTMSNKKIKPYLGLGVGTSYAEQYSYFNIYELGDNNWGFVVRPEAGAFFELNHGFGVLFSGSYQYATNKNNDLKLNNISQFALNLGLVWGY